jgi:hypothetical protein
LWFAISQINIFKIEGAKIDKNSISAMIGGKIKAEWFTIMMMF